MPRSIHHHCYESHHDPNHDAKWCLSLRRWAIIAGVLVCVVVLFGCAEIIQESGYECDPNASLGTRIFAVIIGVLGVIGLIRIAQFVSGKNWDTGGALEDLGQQTGCFFVAMILCAVFGGTIFLASSHCSRQSVATFNSSTQSYEPVKRTPEQKATTGSRAQKRTRRDRTITAKVTTPARVDPRSLTSKGECSKKVVQVGQGGSAVVDVSVSRYGSINTRKIQRSSGNAQLDKAARKEVDKLKFIPAMRGDSPRPGWTAVTVEFAMAPEGSATACRVTIH